MSVVANDYILSLSFYLGSHDQSILLWEVSTNYNTKPESVKVFSKQYNLISNLILEPTFLDGTNQTTQGTFWRCLCYRSGTRRRHASIRKHDIWRRLYHQGMEYRGTHTQSINQKQNARRRMRHVSSDIFINCCVCACV